MRNYPLFTPNKCILKSSDKSIILVQFTTGFSAPYLQEMPHNH